jgi:ceramide glucosyltransferase
VIAPVVMNAVAWIAAVWWGVAIGLLCLSALATIGFPWPRRTRPGGAPPPMTAIVPTKELDPGFEAAQASLFDQDYPDLEILIASAETESVALSAVRVVQARYPEVSSRVVVSQMRAAASPKLNNLWGPIEQARNDVILTKDSNIRLAPGDLEALTGCLDPGVGLVSAIPVLTTPLSPAAWVETSLVNAHARILMLARSLGLGFGLGKVMLFRRSDLERAGGLEVLAWALGEDCALCDTLSGLGLATVLADRVVIQDAGARSWGQLWSRFLRWKIIWRAQSPAAFVGSLFCSALLASCAGALAAPLFGAVPVVVAVTTLLVWFAIEMAVCAARGWPLSLQSPVAFMEREVIDLLVWLRALTTSEVAWAGARYRSDRAARAPLPAE